MKYIFSSLFIAVSSTFVNPANADDLLIVDQYRPLQVSKSIAGPASFFIDNFVGKVSVVEARGNQVEIRAKYEGEKTAQVVFENSDPSQVRIRVQYPEIESEAFVKGPVKITHLRTSGPFRITPGKIEDGQATPTKIYAGAGTKMTFESGSEHGLNYLGWGGFVFLEIGIPAPLLANLRANSGKGDLSLQVQFQNSASPNREIDLQSSGGEINCSGLCDSQVLRVNSESGDVALKEIRGPVELQTTSGKVFLNEHDGDLSIETKNGSINVENHSNGDVKVKTSDGVVELLDMAGDLTVQSGSGDVTVQRVKGKVIDIETMSGHVDLVDTAGDLRVASTSGNISIRKHDAAIINLYTKKGLITAGSAHGQANVETSIGDITWDLGDGDLYLKSQSGVIRTSNHLHGLVQAETKSGDIHFQNEGPDGLVSEVASTRSGQIYGKRCPTL